MKRCKRCGKAFSDNNDSFDSPARYRGELYLDSVGTINADDLCPECREDLGIVGMLGFNR